MDRQSASTTRSDQLRAVQCELAAAWGLCAPRMRALVGNLVAGGESRAGLVRRHALSRRGVEDVLRRLAPWLEWDGDRVRVSPAHAAAVAAAFEFETPVERALPGDAYAAAAARQRDAVAFMAAAMAGLPPPDHHLDHVAATALTSVKRALLLTRDYDLRGARVLCLGDRDLTSLALLALDSGLDVTVADVDARVLAHIAAVARARAWPLRRVFADLRLELPRSLVDGFDLVFTDPPYTPSGMAVFLARGIQALRRHGSSRLVCCYGHGERHPALGLGVQAVLTDLGLVAEAILPAFNRYDGAEAIGSASSLYVCRPTRRSQRAADRLRTGAQIYTQGHAAQDATAAAGSQLAAVLTALAADASATTVGDGWPDGAAAGQPLTLAAYLRDLSTPTGKPPFTAPRHAGAVIVNLLPHYGACTVPLLLASQARRLTLVTDARSSQLSPGVAELIATAYRLTTAPTVGPVAGFVTITAERIAPPVDPADRIMRDLLDHPHAKLANAWREALIRATDACGATITRNEARRRLDATEPGHTHGTSYLRELPLDTLAILPNAIRATLAAD